MDVVVGEGAAILELLAGEDQALLVRRNAFLVLLTSAQCKEHKIKKPAHTLDLGLDIVDCVGRLDLKGDCFASEGLDKDLHDGLWILMLGAAEEWSYGQCESHRTLTSTKLSSSTFSRDG